MSNFETPGADRLRNTEPKKRRPGYLIVPVYAYRAARTAQQQIADVFRVIASFRAPLIVGLIGCFVFALPGQTHEIYRLFSEDFELGRGLNRSNLRFLVFFITLWMTGYVLWYIARACTLRKRNLHMHQFCPRTTMAGNVVTWGPRICGALPAIGVAIGMLLAANDDTPYLRATAAVAAIMAAIKVWASHRRNLRNPKLFDDLQEFWFQPKTRFWLSLAMVVAVAILMMLPNSVMQWLGALSIFCLFLIGLVFLLQQCVFLADRYHVPALGMLIAAAFLFSWFDLNDNHGIRLMKSSAAGIDAPAPGADDIVGAFEAWLSARPDRERFKELDKPYPVFFVAAQGGGLYAAYQAGNFLARMQDHCSAFAQHTFALSGVSGGAVGTTLFAGLVSDFSPSPTATRDDCEGAGDKFESAMKSVASKDFLSPLVFSMLFPDFTARFLPFAVNGFDRARALERSFEEAWPARNDGPSGLEEGLLSYWTPRGASPAVLINTTEVDTGRRLILSPIHDLGTDLRSYARVAQRRDGAIPNMRLSTAMILSARFPWITPAGSIRTFERLGDGPLRARKTRLVDGGYFENSGVDTATDVMRLLSKVAERENVAFKLIVFDLTEDSPREPSYGFGELYSPIKALLMARASRAEISRRRARREFNHARSDDCRYVKDIGGARAVLKGTCAHERIFEDKIWHVSLNDLEHDFQLGWLLSRDTLTRIEHQNGDADSCALKYQNSPIALLGLSSEEDDIVRRHNSCIQYFTEMLLMGQDFGIRDRALKEDGGKDKK